MTQVTGEMLAALAVVALAGLAAGATSIGGVLVVPALTALMQVPLPQAVAASNFAFLVPAVLALWMLGPGRATRARRHAPLLLAALLGAALGAWLTSRVPGAWVRGWIGVLALGSGLYTLWRLRQQGARAAPGPAAPRDESGGGPQAAGGPALHNPHRAPGVAAQLLLGAVVGVGSALSGTGGPVLLLPLLLLWGFPLVPSIVAAQLVQLPVALAASATQFAAGRLDVALGASVGVVLLVTAWAGHRLARGVATERLQVAVAWLLVITGCIFALP